MARAYQEFGQHLEAASKNELPAAMAGEPWRLFEDLVADGVEFCFGRRVNRLGAHKRGKKVSDMVAPLPDFNVIVIDAKATGTEFDASWPSLRALVEYVNKQKERQKLLLVLREPCLTSALRNARRLTLILLA